MIGALNLPAIALLAAISGLPGLNRLPLPASKEHARAKAAAVAADTLPIPWRPVWRRSLEDRFARPTLRPIGQPNGPIRLLPVYDPRKQHVTVDPVAGTFRSVTEVGEVPLGMGFPAAPGAVRQRLRRPELPRPLVRPFAARPQLARVRHTGAAHGTVAPDPGAPADAGAEPARPRWAGAQRVRLREHPAVGHQ
jgi:hypothetical protein